MARALSIFINETVCIDPWWFLFPQNREFSYFSHVHQSYSRIDYFLIDNTPLPSVKKTEYSAIVESDHSPVLLDLCFSSNHRERPNWRLDTTSLSNRDFCRLISTVINVIWGEIISYTAKCNKTTMLRQEQLIESILIISISPSTELDKERLNLQMQYNLLSTR